MTTSRVQSLLEWLDKPSSSPIINRQYVAEALRRAILADEQAKAEADDPEVQDAVFALEGLLCRDLDEALSELEVSRPAAPKVVFVWPRSCSSPRAFSVSALRAAMRIMAVVDGRLTSKHASP